LPFPKIGLPSGRELLFNEPTYTQVYKPQVLLGFLYMKASAEMVPEFKDDAT
jgi:hypothetical protein